MTSYPLIEEVSTTLSAAAAFEGLAQRPHSFFIDSGMDPWKLGRWSFIGSDPFLLVRTKGNETTITDPRSGEERRRWGNPFDVLEELLDEYRLPPGPYPVPFIGGAVGYLGYDLGRFIERFPDQTADDLLLPDLYLAFHDAVVAFDHLENRAYISSTGLGGTGAGGRLSELREMLTGAPHPQEEVYPSDDARGERGVRVRSNFTHDEYLRAVEAAREYIMAGDIFQVNLSQRLEADMPLPPHELYRRLRRVNPAPFACYLNLDGFAVVSASPERFLCLRGDIAQTRPIKGTRPRGRTPAEDEALARELTHSIKDRAENVMIVDLERNDLGRVCRYGTVRVSELLALESYPTVFHLTSTVEGQLRPSKRGIDLIRASFPGGSITGAPKVRAMEIIEELEPTKRAVYTGSIGYLGFDGDLDINIVIRTFIVKGGRAYFQVGGGIVYDSDPEREYQETLDKAKALIQALSLVPELVTKAR